MPSAAKLNKKEEYDNKLCSFLDDYDRAFIVHADNVGSKQFQEIRRALVGNVGLIFTKGDLSSVREEIDRYKVGAPARVGLVAPNDVFVPAGGTGLDPSQTSFFQALNIPTKINKGTVEITTDVHLIQTGNKVGSSEATLLAKLGIKPFSYGLVIQQVFEGGSLYSPKALDIKQDDLMSAVTAAIANVAAISLQLGYPTLASIPHSIVNGYKNVLAVSVATEYTFDLAQKVKDYLADPSAFAASDAPAAAGDSAAAAAPAAEAKKEESEEEQESDEDMGMGGMFD